MTDSERTFLHDISNPITAAIGRSRILKKKVGRLDFEGQKEIIEMLDLLYNSLERSVALIQERRTEILNGTSPVKEASNE